MLEGTAPDIATCRAPSVVTSIPAIGAETQDITHASNKQEDSHGVMGLC